jgi:serine protease Do
MNIKQVFTVVVLSASTTVATLFTYNHFNRKPIAIQAENGKVPANYVGLFDSNTNLPGTQPIDFQQAAQSSVPAVVHITTVIGKSSASNNLPRRNPFSDLFGDDFDDFFGGPQIRSMPQRASGSGVLVSEDGYIVTNNHVIDEAEEIKVTLSNKKSYTAKLIGTDPSSDLAMLKIDAKGLPGKARTMGSRCRLPA